MDRQVLAAFYDELEKIGLAKPDPIRGRPVHAVTTRAKLPPPLPPVLQTRPSVDDDLGAAIALGYV